MSDKLVSVYSHLYTENCHGWSANPSMKLLHELHSITETKRWIACIKDIRIALGDPVKGSSRNEIYIPDWIFNTSGIQVGEEVEIHFEPCELYTKATSLTFTLLDEHEHSDIRDLIEEPLSQIGVLKVGQILPIPVLDGHLILSKCEPLMDWLFLDGNEVQLEIIDSNKKIELPITPLLKNYSKPEEINFDSMLPDSILKASFEKSRFNDIRNLK